MRRQDAGGRDRGQLVVVVALVIATLFVGLALVLNSGIYAENLSTRETGDGGDVATGLATATDEVAVSLEFVNDNHDNHDDQQDTFEAAVDDWSDSMAGEYASRGYLFDLQYDDPPIEGTLIEDDESGTDFTADGDPDRFVVESTSKLAGFEMTVSEDELEGGSTFNDLENDTFYVDVDEEWRVHVLEDGDDIVVVPVETAEINEADEWDDTGGCAFETDEVNINYASATVDGEYCPPLDFWDELSGEIGIEYKNADNVTGTYRLLVSDEDAEGDDVLFGVTVELTYERADIYHDRTTTVTAEPQVYDDA